jgi:large subunit ribosomal protein L13
MPKTFLPKQNEIERKCYLIDAKNKILGRLATRVATILMGKDETYYTPHMQTGDQVVVINAKDVKLSGKKAEQKSYQHYTGYPGGLRIESYEHVMAKNPSRVITEAVRKMLPKNRTRAKLLKHLHVYADAKHEQAAQKPEVLEIK